MAEDSQRRLSVSPTTAFIVVIVAIVAAFLLGFVPEFNRASALNAELSASRERLRSADWQLKLAKARDTGASLFIQLNKRNYGNAAGLASDFFKQVQTAASHAPDATQKNALASVAARRDEIIGKIAKTDASAESNVRDILEQLPTVR
jgi:hypothetical protein